MAEPLFDRLSLELGRRGGGEAEGFLERARSRRYEARNGGVDTIAFSGTVALGVRVFRNGRMGFSYGFGEDPPGVARIVASALFCADASDPDPAYGLPDAREGGAGGEDASPALYDPSCETLPDAEKAAFAADLERETLARDPRVARVRQATLRETVVEETCWNSRGVLRRQRASHYAAFVEAVAEENGDAQTGYGYGFARSLAGLDLRAIAAEGANRALRMLGAVRPASGRRPAVIENVAAAELLEVLLPSFLAPQVVKGKSMLAGRIGTAVASADVTVCDDPLARDGEAATAFDGEGASSRRNVLVENGVLRGYLADAFWGRKLGTGSNGSCRRPGAKTPPTAGASNLGVAPGGTDPRELARQTGDGILLTEFLGLHTADPVSGDFSVGAAGLRIAGGSIGAPLRGFAVSGNVLTLLSAVRGAGSDFRWFGSVGAPSLAVSGVDVAGD